ncbi:tail fiber domain-containing protein [Pseudomarimonas arenosa]|uniref:Peptidase S74 domain-containing protein n=1 Tax=Pseudomarimonas arenosa TaxID=2774145 RepID=A0AAW3ZMQ6_9GAMM|nr:tail fiber domain-containing protein [Pseudomarimonas arenosa]MBD8525671.1 hypothetical protein [Pseudomarimonas arenosa]
MRSAFRPAPALLPLAAALLSLSVAAAAAELQLEAELLQDGVPAEADYEIRLQVDRGQPWIKQTLALGVIRVEDGRLLAPVQLDDRLLSEAKSFALEARLAGSADAFVPLASVAAKGSCALSPWALTGNGDATEQSFIGTTNNQPLRLRANNQQVGILTHDSSTVPGSEFEAVNVQLGWPGNHIGNFSDGVVVMGGGTIAGTPLPNQVDNNADWATISGGYDNRAMSRLGSIGGGSGNRVGGLATVAGGADNQATEAYSTVGGGLGNTAAGLLSSVAGGYHNQATGDRATVPGGGSNSALGDFSLAAGSWGTAQHLLSFVWSQADGTYSTSSSAARQVIFEARGGFGINSSAGPIPNTPLNAELTVRTTGTPDNNVDLMLLNHENNASNFRGFSLASVPNGQFYLTSLYNNGGTLRYDPLLGVTALSTGTSVVSVNRGSSLPQAGAVLQVGDGGNDGNGAHLSSGGTWTNASSREFKTAFSAIDPELILDRLLSLPLSSWTYKDSTEGRHLGPVAEEFAAAFSLGNDPQRISTVDADGVNMAAIQGLSSRLDRENAETRRRLAQENAELRQRLDRLERRLRKIERGQP